MDYKEYDQETLNKLHHVHMEILDEFVRICVKHQLTYFLVGGTLLGAVRHKGFIPWDDDVDVGMPRCDYEKFIEIAKDEINNEYFLDCFETNKGYYLPFIKIRKNKTTFDEMISHHINNHKGIFIDVFPFENVDKNDLNLKIHAFLSLALADSVALKTKTKNKKDIRYPFISKIFMIFNQRILMQWQKKITTFCKNNNSKYLCVIGTGYGYRRELNLRKDILPVKEIEFNSRMVNGMQNNNQYLEGIYGDYMKLPPIEKRRNHMPFFISFTEGKNLNTKEEYNKINKKV